MSQIRIQTQDKQCILTMIIGLTIGFTLGYVALSKQIDFSEPYSSYKLDLMGGWLRFVPGAHSRMEELKKDTSAADKLFNDIRILCWVMTWPNNHKNKAKHVKNTWGKRCNILLFMSSIEDPSLPSVALPVKNGRQYLWGKTKWAFKYVYKHYMNKADWFLKADDDTYVILENLRYMLMPYNTNESIYFGCKFKFRIKQGYMSGGSGYVLSKGALKRFVEIGLTNSTLTNSTSCPKSDKGSEDVKIGRCLEALKVTAGDSRDSLGRGRFFPFIPLHHVIPGFLPKSFWYWKYIYYEEKQGMEGCSDNAVSFHYITANQMYVLEYLIYNLRLYGISFRVEFSQQLRDQK